MGLKKIVRRGVNRLGFDVIRVHRSPQRTLLGLPQLSIGTVIDVGANKGQFARFASQFFPTAQMYCFEPLKEPFRALGAWGEAQGGRVHCFQLALGDREGEVEMHQHMHHSPSSSLLDSTGVSHRLYPQTREERMTRVRLSTLDRALEDFLDGMPRRILLKLDVQGFEDRVLRGGLKVLSQCHAVLLEVCIDVLYDGQAHFCDLVQILKSVGLNYSGNLDQVYGKDGRVIFLDAAFVRQ